MSEDDLSFVTKLIGEALSDNLQSVEDSLVDATESAVNCLGVCGETPAHVAIYRNNRELLLQLLQAGADPMRQNSGGNSLVHTAVMLGRVDLLTLLYETGKCNLELPNKKGHTPLHIARAEFEESDLVASSLFKNWSRYDAEEDFRATVTNGRALCRPFLEEKIAHDRQRTISSQVKSISDHMMQRDRLRRYAGPSSGITVLSSHFGLEYPTGQGQHLMTVPQQLYFKRYKDAMSTTTTRAFAHEMVLNVIQMNR